MADHWWALVPLTILGQVVLSIMSIVYLYCKRRTAQRGDVDAARVVILPIFVPILWTCLICQMIHFTLSIYSYPEMPTWKRRARWEEVEVVWTDTVQYFTTMIAVNIEYNIITALYMQTDLSMRSIRRSVLNVVMYALLTSSTSTYCYHNGLSYETFAFFDGIFLLFESLGYSYLLIRSFMVSRSTFLVYAIYSVVWRALIIPSSIGSQHGIPELYFFWVAFRSIVFSPGLYYTLWRETEYWRGNTRKSLWRINREHGLQESVISNGLPELLTENHLVDFAFLIIDDLLDEGAHSKVYKGRLREKVVAIKLFTPPEMDKEAMKRFIEETRIASRVQHPHIAKFHGLAVRPPDVCMIIEFCERGSLFKVLAHEVLSRDRKLALMVQAASAVSYLHLLTPPIIHRDLKSHNFLVTRAWMLKLADFGESRVVADTQMTGYIGSHAYMSPEIITSSSYNTKADIYSLGIVLWEIVTQQRPYAGIKQMSVLRNVVTGTLRPPLPTSLDPQIARLLEKTWSPNPEARPTAQELINVLLHHRKMKSGGVDCVSLGGGEAKSSKDYLPLPHPREKHRLPKWGLADAKASTPLLGEGRGNGDQKYSFLQDVTNSHLIRERKGGTGRWLLQNMLAKELSEVEKQLDDMAVRRMVLEEQLALQSHNKTSSQPLTRSMSIGGYGSFFSKSGSKSNNPSPRHNSRPSSRVSIPIDPK